MMVGNVSIFLFIMDRTMKEKINETLKDLKNTYKQNQNCFSEEINKIGKTLGRLNMKKQTKNTSY